MLTLTHDNITLCVIYKLIKCVHAQKFVRFEILFFVSYKCIIYFVVYIMIYYTMQRVVSGVSLVRKIEYIAKNIGFSFVRQFEI